MNLIFIYGPPAAGKLTVARALAEEIGYKLFDNHAIINVLAGVFPFGDKDLNPIRSRLGRKFRLAVFNEAAKANVNLVTTCALAGPKEFPFFRAVQEAIEDGGGHVLFVQLRPSREALLERVEDASRKGLKIDSREHLQRELKEKPELFDTFPDIEHLIIDNSKLLPHETAHLIREHYTLPN